MGMGRGRRGLSGGQVTCDGIVEDWVRICNRCWTRVVLRRDVM